MSILFEAFSAFGTVGLSAGITGDLSDPGRLVIIVMMFLGRIGPLTVLAAAGSGRRELEIRYPAADISVG
jgi:trk system potassium uptake protein TrkH